jgi:hypothetical protein
MGAAFAAILIASFIGGFAPVEKAHDIYTNLQGKDGTLCCGGNDCSKTIYRERGGEYEFLTRENEWVRIPQERITFLPVPGDVDNGEDHPAHLCYRRAEDGDRIRAAGNVFGSIYLYCAYINPGST